jgi:hypothetical protein
MFLKLKLQLHEIFPFAHRLYSPTINYEALEKFIKQAGAEPYDIYWFFDKPDEHYIDSDDGFLLENTQTKNTVRWVCGSTRGE